MTRIDVLVLGGGIVGLAAAYQLTRRHPQLSVVVLEKEASVGEHQTGHNSGVLHSGIYYKPGSLKAINCRAGKQAMEQFCREHAVPYEICGKVIVAVDDSERATLAKIFERGQQNQVQCELIAAERLSELEPHAAGVQAIHVPEAGIVNYRRVAETMAAEITRRSGLVVLNAKVYAVRREANQVHTLTTAGDFCGKTILNCTGLFCDRVAKLAGTNPDAMIVPFRGEYFELVPAVHSWCRNLIYPVPDPQFPFLGVHFTRMIEGGVECGPNAVLAFAREGYRKWDVNFRDLLESLTYAGFLRLAAKHWQMGAREMWRSFSKRAFVKALARLMPDIRSEHLVPARAGVRAQALKPDGALVDDFDIRRDGRLLHVLNAPSPAATSSLNIGRLLVDELEQVWAD
jgi:L-2-hydroxyglutarate oxidase